MSYEQQIRILENQLKQLENATNKDSQKINEILSELRRLRRAQYDDIQRVNLDDYS